MLKRILAVIALSALLGFIYIQQVPETATCIVEGSEITLQNGQIVEIFVDAPTDPNLDYPFKGQFEENLTSENISGVFTYVITVKNWINSTSTFTLRQHIHLNEALLVIDLQNHYSDYPQIAAVINRTNTLIDLAHESHRPVIFTKNQQVLKDAGITAWELQDSLNKFPYDYYLTHEEPDAFKETGLDEILRYNDVHKLYIVGADSFAALHRTAQSALRLNYEVVIVSDAHTDFTGSSDITPATVNRLYQKESGAMVQPAAEIQFRR